MLLGRDEVDRRPAHPLISHVAVPDLDIVQVRAATDGTAAEALIAAMATLASTGDGPVEPSATGAIERGPESSAT